MRGTILTAAAWLGSHLTHKGCSPGSISSTYGHRSATVHGSVGPHELGISLQPLTLPHPSPAALQGWRAVR